MSKLLFDIGGTSTRMALSEGSGSVGDALTFPTSQEFDAAVRDIGEASKKLLEGRSLDSASGGVAAMFNEDHSVIHYSPNLPGWSGKPIKSELEKIFGVKTMIENDAALAGLGEVNFGAGRGSKLAVYMTVSTGVGGARIVDGKIDRKVLDFEPGQQIIDQGKTLEKLISGRAVEERCHMNPHMIPSADPIWIELAENLAIGLRNSIVHWQPEAVILGGGMILNDPGIPLDITVKKLGEILKFYPKVPEIKKAELSDKSGLFGASLF